MHFLALHLEALWFFYPVFLVKIWSIRMARSLTLILQPSHSHWQSAMSVIISVTSSPQRKARRCFEMWYLVIPYNQE